MNPEQSDALRKAFPPEAIGKLPKAGISLDYVGHATVTDRLLTVDPAWTWEPMALAPDGGPLIRQGPKELTMWIRLTVCGVTRLGVGSVAANAFDAEKQLVGDALRNAAMRFGVALDLWSKAELESAHVEPMLDCPEACGHQATKDDLRGHLLDRHGWTRHGDGRVTRPKPPPAAPTSAAGAGDGVERSASAPSSPQGGVSGGATAAAGAPPTPATRAKLFALLPEIGVTDATRHAWASDVLGRTVGSFGTLTQGDYHRLIEAAEKAPEALRLGVDG